MSVILNHNSLLASFSTLAFNEFKSFFSALKSADVARVASDGFSKLFLYLKIPLIKVLSFNQHQARKKYSDNRNIKGKTNLKFKVADRLFN